MQEYRARAIVQVDKIAKEYTGNDMEPLASRIRPKNLDEFVGQDHLTGFGKPIRVAIEKKELFSFVLWGPPGSGKTTLARMYAQALGADFYELSAVDAGKEDIKKVIGERSARVTLKNEFELKKLLGCCFEGIVACIQANTQNI